MTYYITEDNFDWDRFYSDFAGTDAEIQENQPVEDFQTQETEFEYNWDVETF